jgi:hypothetical protein
MSDMATECIGTADDMAVCPIIPCFHKPAWQRVAAGRARPGRRKHTFEAAVGVKIVPIHFDVGPHRINCR